MIVAFSIARATNSAPLSVELVCQPLREGSRYPLDMFWHIARTTPLTLLLAIATLVLRACGMGWRMASGRARRSRLWIGWVLWFGVIESGITTNYLLLPISFMLIAIAIDVQAIGRAKARRYMYAAHRADRRRPSPLDQWRGDGSAFATSSKRRGRPFVVPGIEEIRDGLCSPTIASSAPTSLAA